MDFRLAAGQFKGHGSIADIDHLGAKNMHELGNVAAFGRRTIDFDQYQFPTDKVLCGDIGNMDDIDQFVQLFVHLFDNQIVPANHQGNMGGF